MSTYSGVHCGNEIFVKHALCQRELTCPHGHQFDAWVGAVLLEVINMCLQLTKQIPVLISDEAMLSPTQQLHTCKYSLWNLFISQCL